VRSWKKKKFFELLKLIKKFSENKSLLFNRLVRYRRLLSDPNWSGGVHQHLWKSVFKIFVRENFWKIGTTKDGRKTQSVCIYNDDNLKVILKYLKKI
jgi:hypothetical protein